MEKQTLKFNLSKKDGKFIEGIFIFIRESTQFSHVIYHNKEYYEMSNTWHSGKKIKKRPSYDKDIKCDEYTDKDDCKGLPTIFPKHIDSVKYVIDYGLDYDDCFFIDNEIDIKPIEKMEKYEPENIVFTGFDKMIISSDNYSSDDHRGSNHCKVELDYIKEKTFEKEVTLEELTVTHYQFKTNKWDKWYELAGGCTVKRKGKDIHIKLSYDHGS